MKSAIAVAVAIALSGHLSAVQAQEDNRITVLASGHSVRLDRVAQSISVLDEHDLARVQGPDIIRVLQRLPGVTIARNGGLGSFTGLSVRGAASERTLVLIDGVRMNDVAGPAGGFDFGSIVSNGIARVELLRGPASLMWGANAMGGVIHLSTRQADGAEAEAEYGGDDQFAGSVAIGYRSPDIRAGIAASYVTRRGFSSAAGGTEADGFQQLALSARGEAAVSGALALFASARYAASSAEIDGFPAPTFTLADTRERQDMRQIAARAGAELSYRDYRLVLSVAQAETQRDLLDEDAAPLPYYSTRGRSTRAEARASLGLGHGLALMSGADWERTSFADGMSNAATSLGSAHAMLAFLHEQGRTLGLNAGMRVDRHRDFGTATTFAASGQFSLNAKVLFRAAYGEAFKVPSLFQLHSDYGNSALRPERSRGIEAGLDLWSRGQERRIATLTAFRSTSRNLIDFVSCPRPLTGICAGRPFGTYANVGRALQQGVEAEAAFQLTPRLQLGLAYAFTDHANRDTGRRLARRPRHAGSLSLDWQVLADGRNAEGLALGVDLRAVSASFDDPSNSVRLGGHALLDLRANWAVSPLLELYGRVENAWNERCQTTSGYATQGRAAYLGARVRLHP